MIATRHGRCTVCRQWVSVQRDFPETLDMLGQKKAGINKDVLERLKDWRDQPLVCPVHELVPIKA